uniref:Nodulin-like domain-containing protein n=1 Tax=Ananas comosus var. bracteatus TaxID=296719 RepID=A0A6V7PHW8_ANACO|nr:unnamed protein product [Ananas comosus var. bracteatus]
MGGNRERGPRAWARTGWERWVGLPFRRQGCRQGVRPPRGPRLRPPPPAALLLIGSLEALLAYGIQWLVVRRSIPPLPYWQMCVVLCMGGNSTTWMNTAVLVTCMRNFRRSRGPVSGVLKGFVGLSTALFTDLSASLSPSPYPFPSSFLLLLALAAAAAAAILFLRDSPRPDGNGSDDDDDARCFAAINALTVAIALYLLARDLSGAAPSAAFARGSSPPRRARRDPDLHRAPIPLHRRSRSGVAPPPEALAIAAASHEGGEDLHHFPTRSTRWRRRWGGGVVGGDGSVVVGVGTGLAVMNNLGQMGKAMGYGDVSVFVSLTSISGFFGRIASGSLSEHFLKYASLSVPPPFFPSPSHFILTRKNFKYHSCEIRYAEARMECGLADPNGRRIRRDGPGPAGLPLCRLHRRRPMLRRPPRGHGPDRIGALRPQVLRPHLQHPHPQPPLGSFVFSGLLAGILYDAEATGTAARQHVRRGHCYWLVFVVMAGACLVGFGLDVLLAFRTRKVYLRIHASKNLNRNKEGKEGAGRAKAVRQLS